MPAGNPMGYPEGDPRREAAEAQQQADPVQDIKKFEDGLLKLQSALGEAGFPKEVMAPLSEAIGKFGEFVSVLTGNANPDAAPKGMMSADVGSSRAIPADQPMSKRAKAMPA